MEVNGRGRKMEDNKAEEDRKIRTGYGDREDSGKRKESSNLICTSVSIVSAPRIKSALQFQS